MKYIVALITCFFLLELAPAQVIIVWPGDANNNGIANHIDLLNVGLGYGSTGNPRNQITNFWSAQTLINAWGTTLPQSGLDYSYLDCNGSGTIDSLDIEAIEINFGLTHGQVIPDSIPPAGGMPLFFQLPNDSLAAGSTDTIPIMIGNSGTTSNLYGIAFTINFDTSLIDSAFLVTDNGIFSSPIFPSISISNFSKAKGQFDIAISQTNQTNIVIAGQAQIAGLGLVMVDNLKTAVTSKMLNLSLKDAFGINASEVLIPLNPISDSLLIYTGIEDVADIKQNVFLSRTGDWLQANSTVEMLESMSLWDIAGRKISSTLAEDPRQVQLNIAGITQGLYLLQIHTSKGTFSEKLMIK